ncbi:Serine/threonine protein phosphatase PrpC [Burkholderiales bacterium 8X]|nr:Serine/threonine protein phosphatase PrpC [Burkholderiales bacterium 8X]
MLSLSRQGGRSYNEDAFGHWHDDRYVACVVADGAGGHGGGDVAAAIVRDSVLAAFSRAPGLEPERLGEAIQQANLDVVARQAAGGKLAAMRSTVVMAVLDLHAHAVAWAHCGDSRAYLFRGGLRVARTVDHSLVQQMVDGGMLDDESARLHPQRNLLLTALGSIEPLPEVSLSAPLPLMVGDVLLLCTDGVWEPIGDARLLQLLQMARRPAEWMEHLDREIKATAKPDHDNYTALALWVNEDEVEPGEGTRGNGVGGEPITQLMPMAPSHTARS